MDAHAPIIVTMDIESRFPADHAMKAEFQAAVESRSIERLRLFIDRHPRTEQAKQAAALIERLRNQKKQ